MAITSVQRNKTSGLTGPGIAFLSSPTSGNVLIAVGVTLSGSPAMGISDTIGNSWTLLGTYSTATCGMQIWSATNKSTAADTVSLSSGVTATHLYIVEVSGIIATLDKTNSATSTTTNVSTGNVTTANANEFMLAIFAVNASPFLSGGVAAGWSNDQFRNGSGLSSDYDELIVSSTGTYNAARTDGDSGVTNLGAIFTFPDTGGAPAPATFARAATVMVIR